MSVNRHFNSLCTLFFLSLCHSGVYSIWSSSNKTQRDSSPSKKTSRSRSIFERETTIWADGFRFRLDKGEETTLQLWNRKTQEVRDLSVFLIWVFRPNSEFFASQICFSYLIEGLSFIVNLTLDLNHVNYFFLKKSFSLSIILPFINVSLYWL